MRFYNNSIVKSRGLIGLDILRGLAAWMVAIPHFFLFTGYYSNTLEYLSILAVEIFFILSGFVLGPQLSMCLESKKFSNLKIFFMRRWLRTLPIFFVILFLFMIFSDEISIKKFFYLATFTNNFFSYDKTDSFFLVAWSLAIEEWFYILFPIIGFILFRKTKVILFTCIFIIFLVLAKTYFEFYSNLNYHRVAILRLDSIALGFLIYQLTLNINTLKKNFLFYSILVTSFLVILSYFFFLEKKLLFFLLVTNLLSILLIVILKYNEKIFENRNLLKKISAFFAHTSYCVYLCHSLIILIFFNEIQNYSSLIFLQYIFIIILFSTISFYIIEKPFQNIKPDYYEIKNNKNTGKKFFYIATTNLILLSFFLILLENFSKLIPDIINKVYNSETIVEKKKINNFTVNDYIIFSDKKGLDRDFKNYTGDKYISYLTHLPSKYSSKYVNIGENSLRKNKVITEFEKNKNKEKFIIWLIGSSAIFGATNSDEETISSNLEEILNRSSYEKNFEVINMGIQGYNSLQDYLHLKMRFSEKINEPNLILVINGFNDYYTASLSSSSEIFSITRTWSNSYSILSNAWEHQNNAKIINVDMAKSKFYNQFNHFIEFTRLIKKWINYKYYNFYPKAFNIAYYEKVNKSSNILRQNIDLANKFYITNMKLIIRSANELNIPIIVAQQPALFNITKNLHSTEQEYLKHRKLEFFSSETSEFTKNSIPAYEIDRKYFLNYKVFKNGYKRQKEDLKFLAKKENSYFIDLETSLNQFHDVPIFTSLVHFSVEGSKEISKILFEYIDNFLKN